MARGLKPAAVASVERLLGGDAISWDAVVSRGYAVGERWIVRLADGRSAFVKVGVEDWMVDNMRAEMTVYSQVDAPFLPRVLAWAEDETPPLLVLEDLSGAEWPPPWTAEHVQAVMTTLDEVAATPPPPGLRRLEDDFGSGWDAVAADPAPFLSLGVASQAWLETTLDALRVAEKTTPFAGSELVHCDARSDNLCIRDGRAILFDWNWARVGNAAIDYAFWLPTLRLEDGPRVADMAEKRPACAAFAACVAGFFASRAGLPEPPTAPGVRAFQLAQLEVALPWATGVHGLPQPDGRIRA